MLSGSKNRLKLAALSLLALVLCLGTAETVMRLAGTAPALHRIRTDKSRTAFRVSDNPVLGYVLRENHRDPDANLHDSWPVINSHGQRDIERDLAKPPGTKRILVLGDSVVQGNGIRELDNTISRRLELLLQNHGVEVLNFGVSGYCTRSEVELLKEKGLRYDPDLVILLFVSNDYAALSNDLINAAWTRPRWQEWIFVHSALFRTMALQLDWFDFRKQFVLNTIPNDFSGAFPNAAAREAAAASGVLEAHMEAVGPDNVEHGLRLLKTLALEHGFQPLILIWPDFFPDRIADVETYFAFTRGGHSIIPEDAGTPLVIEQMAEAFGLPCRRLSPYFRRHAAAHPEFADYSAAYTIGDGTHPSELAGGVAARAIAEIIHPHLQGD